MQISDKCAGILEYMLRKDGSCTVGELTGEFKMSARTMYVYLENLEYWLKSRKLGKITREHSKGITLELNKGAYANILTEINTALSEDIYLLSEKRINAIAIELFTSPRPLTLKDIESRVKLSRNTALKAVKALEALLRKFELLLVKKQNVGMEIVGEELKKREALIWLIKENESEEKLIHYIRTLPNIAKTGSAYSVYKVFRMLNRNELLAIDKCIGDAVVFWGVNLTDGSYIDIFICISIMIWKIKSGCILEMDSGKYSQLRDCTEYGVALFIANSLAEFLEIEMNLSEVLFLTRQLLITEFLVSSESAYASLTNIYENGYQGQAVSDTYADKIDCRQISSSIIGSVIKQFPGCFCNEDRLHIDLAMHLRLLIFKHQYKIVTNERDIKDFRLRYNDIFRAVKEAVSANLSGYGLELDDTEIAYIAMLFAADLKNNENTAQHQFNVILICGSTVGTSRLLLSRLRSAFPQINNVEIVSYYDLLKREHIHTDLIVSTVKLPELQVPCIVVSPLLTNKDIESITAHIKDKRPNSYIAHDAALSLNALFDIIKKSCDIKDYKQLYSDLYSITMNSNRMIGFNNCEGRELMLKDLLKKENIQLDVEADNWEEAIRSGADILLLQDKIEERYINGIVNMVKKLGPYMAIAPGLLISHAKPEDGVKELSMSFIRLKTPVNIGSKSNDPIKLIFTLAAADKRSHLNALSQLSRLFMNKSDLQSLLDCTTSDEAAALFEKYSV